MSKTQIASYFSYAFEWVWSDEDIVAVTPFLLYAGSSPFSQFSLLDAGENFNDISMALYKMSKTKGQPSLNIEAELTSSVSGTNNIPLKIFPKNIQYEDKIEESTQIIATFIKWLFKIPG